MTDLDEAWSDDEGGEVEVPRREGYLATSRGTVNALILAAPLFALYQIGLLVTDGWKNGLDFVTARLFELVGRSTWLYVLANLVVLGGMLVAARLMESRRRPTGSTWVLMLLESVLYAALLGLVVTRILSAVGIRPSGLSLSAVDNLVLSMGAGAYEELVFRLLLMSGLLWVGRRFDWQGPALWAGVFGVSSLLFSLAHYPPFGDDPWALWSFSYRFVAGLVFAALYVTRGFAVAAYTHALYDIHVLVLS